jgi:hypothetical protein
MNKLLYGDKIVAPAAVREACARVSGRPGDGREQAAEVMR